MDARAKEFQKSYIRFKKLEGTEMWFLGRMLQILWIAEKSKQNSLLQNAYTTRSYINRIQSSPNNLNLDSSKSINFTKYLFKPGWLEVGKKDPVNSKPS